MNIPNHSLYSETIATGQAIERRKIQRIKVGAIVSSILAVLALWKALF
jgi:hypothetical protein